MHFHVCSFFKHLVCTWACGLERGARCAVRCAPVAVRGVRSIYVCVYICVYIRVCSQLYSSCFKLLNANYYMSVVQQNVMVSMFFKNITLLATMIVVGVISWHSSKKYYDHIRIRELEMELQSYRTSTLTKGILIATIVVIATIAIIASKGFLKTRQRTCGAAYGSSPMQRARAAASWH